MPIFEFECRSCGASFEKLVPSASTPVACACGETAGVAKKLSVFSTAAARTPAKSPCGQSCAASGSCPGASCSSGCCPF